MKSSTTKLFFLLSHLAGLCYFLLDVEYFSVTGLVLVLLGTLLTACNYWLWLSPMNRVRDVSNLAWLADWLIHYILPFLLLSSLTLVSVTSARAS